jgi:hypothetical protein
VLVHVHVPDAVGVVGACRHCDTPLPVRVVEFRHRWHVGQICLRCRYPAWTLNLGGYATADRAQQALLALVSTALPDG